MNDCNTFADDGVNLTDGSSAGDWRLPNIREHLSLIDYGEYNPALPSGYSEVFDDVQSTRYWSSTQLECNPGHAYVVIVNNGELSANNTNEGHTNYVWPVRGETCEVPTAIPTLSEWGVIIFMTLIMGIGVVILYRCRIV